MTRGDVGIGLKTRPYFTRLIQGDVTSVYNTLDGKFERGEGSQAFEYGVWRETVAGREKPGSRAGSDDSFSEHIG